MNLKIGDSNTRHTISPDDCNAGFRTSIINATINAKIRSGSKSSTNASTRHSASIRDVIDNVILRNQAKQSVYAKKNIDAVNARQALLQKEIALEEEKQTAIREASRQQLEQIRARVEANKAEWSEIKRINEEEKQASLLKQRLRQLEIS